MDRPLLEEENHQRGIMAPVRMVQSDSVGFADSAEPLPSDRQRYIPCGDHRNEQYRLSTFAPFRSSYPVKIKNVAKNGFYCLGYRDRVQCFSCGNEMENWLESDNAPSPMWHASDCSMLHQQESQNSERSVYQTREWSRLVLQIGESTPENQNGAEQDQKAASPLERRSERHSEERPQLAPPVASIEENDSVVRASQIPSSNSRRRNADAGNPAYDQAKRPRRSSKG